MEHVLKCWPKYFEEVLAGRKPFDVRVDDRPYQVGDTVLLREWERIEKCFTGRETRRTVTYVMRDPDFCKPGYVVLGLSNPELEAYQKTQLAPEQVVTMRDEMMARYQWNEHYEAENKRLQQWVDDLQSGMYVNCVYCGHRYGPRGKTPVSMANELKQHIEQCPKHPMSVLKAENAKLVAERDTWKQRAEGSPLKEFIKKLIHEFSRAKPGDQGFYWATPEWREAVMDAAAALLKEEDANATATR